MRTILPGVVLSLVLTTALWAQVPQPFPRPGAPAPPRTPPADPAPAPPPSAPAPAPAPLATTSAPGEPTEAMLGAPLYPSAVFLTSYDAGRGQRFYLFGVNVPYQDLVTYYKTVLKQKGDQLFESPPTYQFDTARFRDESMAFAPSVTLKDYTWGGSAGFPNPVAGATPERFRSVIQIVPAPH